MTKDGESTIILTFKLEKETPGTYRYQEVTAKGETLTAATGAWIGPLYLRKDKWKTKPQTLKVEITVQ